MSTPAESNQTAKIRALNDELRHNFSRGHAVITPGIAALSPAPVRVRPLIPPKPLEPIRREGGVARRVLSIPMAEIGS